MTAERVRVKGLRYSRVKFDCKEIYVAQDSVPGRETGGTVRIFGRKKREQYNPGQNATPVGDEKGAKGDRGWYERESEKVVETSEGEI